ncbi:MAG: LVIVD repeat-containing protein [Actinomycetes bacterium]
MTRRWSALAALVVAAPLVTAATPAPTLDLAARGGGDAAVEEAVGLERTFVKEYGAPNLSGTSPFFSAGTDLAFDGDIVYATEQAENANKQGGIHVLDVSDPDQPVERGLILCPGNQNDVAVLVPGQLVALAFHSAFATGNNACVGGAGAGRPTNGVRIFDVSEFHDPEITAPQATYVGGATTPGGTHTLTVHPSGDYIYASPGGLPGNGGVGGDMQIIDVRDPSKPKVTPFRSNAIGCHDFSFFTAADGRDLGVCVGFGETAIWDTSNPAAPRVIGHIANPLITFHHTGVVTDDGRYLVVGDEAFGAHDCVGGPTGALFMYDLTVPEAPVPLSYFGLDRNSGGAPVSAGRADWCTAHLYNFIPGTRIMVVSWYSGGINVIDWTNVLAPREIGSFRTDGVYANREVTNYWSAYFHQGRVYANDRVRGLDALAFTGELAELADLPEDPEARAEVLASIPSTSGGWHAGRFFDTPTPEQAAYLASRPAPDPTSPSLVCVLR